MNFNISNLTLKKNFIALIGFMGVGKTSIGRVLSKKLNLSHIDTDAEIEKIKSMKINDIFQFYGENYFRELEQDIITDIIKKNKYSVISLGGGSFLNIKIREEVKKNCISVWLNANIDIIYDRIVSSKNIRPLFSKIGNKEDLEALLIERSFIYKEADIKIEIEKLNKNDLIEKILNQLKYYRV